MPCNCGDVGLEQILRSEAALGEARHRQRSGPLQAPTFAGAHETGMMERSKVPREPLRAAKGALGATSGNGWKSVRRVWRLHRPRRSRRRRPGSERQQGWPKTGFREGRPSAMRCEFAQAKVELSGRGPAFTHAAEDDAGVDATQHALPARTVVGEPPHQRHQSGEVENVDAVNGWEAIGEELNP